MNDSMDLRFLAARKKYIEGRFSMLNEMQRQAVHLAASSVRSQ